MTTGVAAQPPISVTVSTIQGWPTIRRELMTVVEAVRRAGGELIVTDGSGRKPPADEELGGNVIWAVFPGESVFQLRARAYGLATGEIVAITEDHVAVPPDWADLHLRAHRRHPEAVAIGGSVENGATDSVMDWAGFLAVQAPIVAPIRTGVARRIAGALNVSYKRAALEGFDDHDGLGILDTWHQKKLRAESATLRNDDSIRVSHDQPLGFRRMTAIHYDAARTFAGFRRRRFRAIDMVWLFGAPVLPIVRTLRVAALLTPRGYGRLLVRCMPAILWLFYVQAVGHVTGYLFGPGDSPRRLQ